MREIQYTNALCVGNNILFTAVDKKTGVKSHQKIKYQPTIYSLQDKHLSKSHGYKTLNNEQLVPHDFDSISTLRYYIDGFDGQTEHLYGMLSHNYSYLNEIFPEQEIEYDKNLLKIANIDIEVSSDEGFPKPEDANGEVTAITVEIENLYYVWGCGDYEAKATNERYTKCDNEMDLLELFLIFWQKLNPDIVTGWNIEFFDFPYLINRITKLWGDPGVDGNDNRKYNKMVKMLSPWGMFKERNVFKMGRNQKAYDMLGISTLDYMEMYFKYIPGEKESYRLDYISHVELGERKLSYEEHGSLLKLHQNDYQKFIEYNIQDVKLVKRLDDKLKLIDMVVELAYSAKVNFNDVFSQVRMWDVMIYNHLKNKNIIIPFKKQFDREQFDGAYVKETVPGKYKWIVSFDLTSLYPHLIMQYGISPENFVKNHPVSLQKMVDGEEDLSWLPLNNQTICPNGSVFKRELGFMGEMLETLFLKRKEYKQKMIQSKNELELKRNDHGFTDRTEAEIENDIAKYDIMQQSRKVGLNSAYGAFGSNYFRFYDKQLAEAVTLSGQLSIKWLEKRLNKYLNKLLGTTNFDYVIAADTDSLYVSFDKLVEKIKPDNVVDFLDKVSEEKIQPFIDDCYEDLAEYVNAYQQKMFMKREAIAETAIFTAKKRYAMAIWDNEGVRYSEPKLKVTGLEAVRSSTPEAVRNKIKEAYMIMLLGTNSELISFNEKFRKEFKTLPAEDIGMPSGVKGLKKNSDGDFTWKKGTPAHVKASFVYNRMIFELGLEKKYEPIKEGEKIKRIHLKMPNPSKHELIAILDGLPPEFGLEDYIDYDQQFDKCYNKPLGVLCDFIDWTMSEEFNMMDFL